jgi:hypothetical protein
MKVGLDGQPAIRLVIGIKGTRLLIPKGVKIPQLDQKPLKKSSLKRAAPHCHGCGIKGVKKYVCSKTKRISCSFECFKKC